MNEFSQELDLCNLCNNTIISNNASISACAKYGEQFSKVHTTEYPEICCEGLTEWNSGFDTRISIGNKCYDTMMVAGSPVGTCIKAGDGFCGSIENVCNSPEDCSNGQNSDYVLANDFCNTAYSSYCDNNPFKDELEMCGLCSSLQCGKQGETIQFTDPNTPNECCTGLEDVKAPDGISVADSCYWKGTASGAPILTCSDCGNGICEDVESVCSCAEDCSLKNNSDYNTVQDFCDSKDYNYSCGMNEFSQELDLCNLCPV
jgi:hypothetical protein